MQETTAGSEHGRRIPVRGVEGCKCCDEMPKGFLCACCVCMQSLSCTKACLRGALLASGCGKRCAQTLSYVLRLVAIGSNSSRQMYDG